ncbi:MAG: hypothetical protein QXI58_00555 [Candidatus Micrarchaeia archaeon]
MKRFEVSIHQLKRGLSYETLEQLKQLEIEQLIEVMRELAQDISDSYYIIAHIINIILEKARLTKTPINEVIKFLSQETKLSRRELYNLARIAKEYSVEEWLSYPMVPFSIKVMALTIKNKKEREEFLNKVNDEGLTYRQAREYLLKKKKGYKEEIIAVSYIGFWDSEAEVLHTPDGAIDILEVLKDFDGKKIKISISQILESN